MGVLPDEEVIEAIIHCAKAKRPWHFNGLTVSGDAVSEGLRQASDLGASITLRNAHILGHLEVSGGFRKLRLSRCRLQDLTVDTAGLNKFELHHCGGDGLSSRGATFGAFSINGSAFKRISASNSKIRSLKISNSQIGNLSSLHTTFSGAAFIKDSHLEQFVAADTVFMRSISLGSTHTGSAEFIDSVVRGDFIVSEPLETTFTRSTVLGHLIREHTGDTAAQLASETPSQQLRSPLLLTLRGDRFSAAPPPESESARLSGMASAHSQISDSARHALREFDGGNRPRVADLIRSYLSCLGDCAEAVDEVGLGFAAVRLEAQAKYLYEDGLDLLFGEKRAALEELLAVHRHFEGQLAKWKEFQDRALNTPVSEEGAALVAKAAEPLATDMAKASEAFAPELSQRLHDLAEAGSEPGLAAPEVRYGMAQGVANTVNFLGGFVLRCMRKTGKKTADRLEEELSDAASEKLAKAAKALLLGSAKQLLALSGIPMFEWVGRVVKLFLEEEEGKGKD